MKKIHFADGTDGPDVTPTCTNQSHSCGGGRTAL